MPLSFATLINAASTIKCGIEAPRLAGLSQAQFAALIGISPLTLQNWDQGHRRPEGTARALLRMAESHPQAVLEALHQ